jgi:hypothetical protein
MPYVPKKGGCLGFVAAACVSFYPIRENPCPSAALLCPFRVLRVFRGSFPHSALQTNVSFGRSKMDQTSPFVRATKKKVHRPLTPTPQALAPRRSSSLSEIAPANS